MEDKLKGLYNGNNTDTLIKNYDAYITNLMMHIKQLEKPELIKITLKESQTMASKDFHIVAETGIHARPANLRAV